MFPLALSLPLLVAAGAPTPVYNVSNLQFNPLAYTTKENLAARAASYTEGNVYRLPPGTALQNGKFGPAPAHFVQPVFSVEPLN